MHIIDALNVQEKNASLFLIAPHEFYFLLPFCMTMRFPFAQTEKCKFSNYSRYYCVRLLSLGGQ